MFTLGCRAKETLVYGAVPGPQLSILQCQGDCSTSCRTQEPSHESFCSFESGSQTSVYWNHLEPLCTSDSWASPMEILIRKLSWWVWGPERASLLASLRGMLLIQGPHSKLSCCTRKGDCASVIREECALHLPFKNYF